MTSLLVRGGSVIDGTGAATRSADVLVHDDRIEAVGPGPYAADRVIDATGLAVAPGFIDIHTHSDLSLLIDRRGLSKLLQGVTCEVVGNCGMSPAPRLPGDDRQRDAMAYMDREIDWLWGSYFDYVQRLDGCALNVASLVGHIALRTAVMGFDDRPPTAAELDRMKGLLGECFEAGAAGFTTGLIYPPSCYADCDEITALCDVVAAHGGLYASHIRGEARTLQSSIAECLETGRRTGCRVQISHLKAAGRANWGGVAAAIEQIERALADGVDVAMDVYPYTAGSTQLSAMLPPWVHEGGRDALLQRAADPEVRRAVREQAAEPPSTWTGYPLREREDWEQRFISFADRPENEWMVGQDLWAIAAEMRLAPYDAVCEIVVRDQGRAEMVAHHLCADDMRQALGHPRSAVASDGLAIVPEGSLGRGRPHPRFYGTFPRVLGRFVRDEGWLGLEDAVRKMTSLPADRLGLTDRGRLQPGCHADLVLFDPAEVLDLATYDDPHQFPAGIRKVIVNGTLVAEDGRETGALPGRLLH